MSTAKSTQTLAAFMRAKVKDGCAVCELPAEVRAQLGRPATKRGFTREDQVQWLREVVGATKITLEALDLHLRGNHDREDA